LYSFHQLEIELIGKGELIWIPSFFKKKQGCHTTKVKRLWAKLRQVRKTQQINICHDLLLSNLTNYQINLSIFHWISEDSQTILDYIQEKQVPYVVINHFQNTRLKSRLMKAQISDAEAIGGVSNVNVPRFVQNRFTNLSDGIDTNFFSPQQTIPSINKLTNPKVLLPARIAEGKGHIDAISALIRLKHEGVNAT